MSQHSAPGRRRIGRKIALVAIALVAASAAYAFIPRHADLRAFDPGAMAQAETAMWRDYYEKRYVPLFLELYCLARTEQGFSPWESFSLAFNAAQAAKNFQPSRSRAEADVAMPQLIAYFRILGSAAPVATEPERLAQTELDWWQARREAGKPEVYGLTVARVSSLLYGIDNEDVRRSGIMRANAMAYRDARHDKMTDADWASIAEQLTASYGLLKQAVALR